MNPNSNYYNNIFKRIYNEVYIELSNTTTEVFLCGGASFKGHLSARDNLRFKLVKNKNLRLLYPEDLFMDMLNRDKNYDLLSLEKFLADNSDYIIIVCESAGSLVELGAFTNNDQTVSKVIAVFEEKRRRDKSFIMLGPVKVLKKQGSEHVIFYDNIEDLQKKVMKNIDKLNSKNRKKSNAGKPLDSLIGLFQFLVISLYFFKYIEMNNLKLSLVELFKVKGYTVTNFDSLFRPALKLMYKNKLVLKSVDNGDTIYSLTEKGSTMALNSLYNSEIIRKNKLFDGIRFDIMKYEYYSS